MKKIVLFVVLSLLFLVAVCYAAQITCSGTAATVWAGSGTYLQPPKSVCFQNQDSTNTVYLDTYSTLTTSTAGIKLTPGLGICIDNTKTPVYGITAGSSVQVGVTLYY